MRVVAIGWRVTADERCVGAQRPKPCKPVQALARVACAVPPALLARGGHGYATRAPSVQRVYMGGVCNRQGYCPCCGADAAAHQQQCDEQCSDHYLLQQLLGWRDLWPILVGADALGCVRAISATARTDCCQVRETSYGSHQKQ